MLRNALLCAVLALGCQPTRLHLRVQTPGEPEVAGSRVRLIIDEQPVCSGGVLFAGQTDPDGTLRVHTPACGPARLVVARPGRRTVVQELDTCHVESLEVVLWPAPPPEAPAHPCAQRVQDFLAAWVERDHDAARAFWLEPEAYSPHAHKPSESAPWSTEIETPVVQGNLCHVRATQRYDFGCELTWQLELELEQGGATWGIRALQPVSAEEP